MTDKDLFRQALTALEDDGDGHTTLADALRARLAQPEAEPVDRQIESINAVFDAWRNGEDASMTLGLTQEPYLCIKPACGPDCSGCNCAISPQTMRDYATRYARLRAAPLDAIKSGGVFAGRTPENVVLNGDDLDAALDAAIPQAQPAPAPVVPDGWVMVPNYRGYAALGTGQYLIDISGDANPAELIIHVATEQEKAGRTVGDLLDKRNPGESIPAEKMAVRLAFFTVAGLDALELQLRILRETHFAAAPAVPAVQPLTDERVFSDDNIMAINGELGLSMHHWMRIVRAIERAHGITGDKP